MLLRTTIEGKLQRSILTLPITRNSPSLLVKIALQSVRLNSSMTSSVLPYKNPKRKSKIKKLKQQRYTQEQKPHKFLASNQYKFSDDKNIIKTPQRSLFYQNGYNQKLFNDKKHPSYLPNKNKISNDKPSNDNKTNNNKRFTKSYLQKSDSKPQRNKRTSSAENKYRNNSVNNSQIATRSTSKHQQKLKPTIFSVDSFINITSHSSSFQKAPNHNTKITNNGFDIDNKAADDILNLDIQGEEEEQLGISVWDQEQQKSEPSNLIIDYDSKAALKLQDIPLLVPKNKSFDENIFSKNDDDPCVSTNNNFLLRDYQKECILSCLKALDSGRRRIAVSLATGGGKTVIFANLIRHVQPFDSSQGDKTLILVHRKELAEQAFNTCQKFMGINSEYSKPISIELDLASSVASGKADITVASIQTLASEERLAKYDPQDFKLIIIDEAHHSAANSYINILNHFNAGKADTKVAVVGFSATLTRHDGKSLMSSMDHIVYHKGLTEMIKDGWLCDAKFTTVKNEFADLSTVSTYAGDYSTASLSKILNSDESNDLILRTYLKYDQQHNFKSTILFGVDVQHVMDLCKLFNSNGVHSEFVSGKTKKRDREQILQNFKNGTLPVIMNCGVFTEGTDIPNIDCVLLARPTKSRGLLLQMIGRGLRKHEGKSFCHVIEFISLKGDLVSAPSLVGLPHDFNAEDASLEDLANEKEKEDQMTREMTAQSFYKETEKSFPGMKDGKVLFDRFDSFEIFLEENKTDDGIQYSEDHQIFQNHELPWIRIKNDTWIAGLIGIGYIRIIKDIASGNYSVIFYSSNQRATKSEEFVNSAATTTSSTGPSSSSSPLLTESKKIPYYIWNRIDNIPDLFTALDMVNKKFNSRNESIFKKSLKNAAWRTTSATSTQKQLIRRFFEQTLQKKLYFNHFAHPEFTQKYIDYFDTFSKGMCTDLIFSRKVAGNRLFVVLAERLLEMYQDRTTKNFFNQDMITENESFTNRRQILNSESENYQMNYENGTNVL